MTNCFLKLLIFSVACFLTTGSFFAQAYSSQISITSDNDNYTFKRKDRYYTNGLNIRFSKLVREGLSGASKKIWMLEGGQKIYNPYRQNKDFLETMDRPFTGLLYFRTGFNYISSGAHVLHWNALAGFIGKAALGEEVQRWHHRNFGLPRPHGWETQLKSEAVLNLQAVYYRHLSSQRKNKLLDVHLKGEVNAGTLFTGMSTGLAFKLGAFEKAANSAHWDARLHRRHNSADRRYEFYIYFEPALTYQVFNATVQGGLFTGHKSVYTTGIQPFYYHHSFGMVYAKNRWITQLKFTYKTKEAATMRTTENFGSIGVGYLLH